jgi:hypothetical protein
VTRWTPWAPAAQTHTATAERELDYMSMRI